MLDPDEQDNQIVDPGYDALTSTPSSPPDRLACDVTRDHPNSVGTLSDLNVPKEETQNDSLGSRVEETQFFALERDPQALDESFSKSTGVSQTNAGTCAATAAFDLPVFTIERPKDPSLDSDVSGFKFGKASIPSSASLERHHGKILAVDTTSCSWSIASAVPSKQHLLGQLQSKTQQIILPSNAADNLDVTPVIPSQDMKAAADNRHNPGPSAPSQTVTNPQPAPNEQSRGEDRETSRQLAPPKVVDVLNASTPKPASISESIAKEDRQLPQRSLPHQSAPKASNKTNSQTTLEQPFPEVCDPSPGRGTKTGSGSNRRHAAGDSQTFRPADVSGPLPDTAPNNHGVSAAEHVTEQEHASRPFPQLGTVAAPHSRDDGREGLPSVNARKSRTGHSKARSQVDDERRHASQPPSRPQSRPTSALSNTARQMRRPVVEDLSPQGISMSPASHFKNSAKVQKSTAGQAHAGRESKSRPQANSGEQNILSNFSTLCGMLDYLPGIEEALKDYERQKEDLKQKEEEIEKLKTSTAHLNDQNRRLAEKVPKLIEMSTRYKAHMNEVVAAQKYLKDEQDRIQEAAEKVRADSDAQIAQEKRLRNLITTARGIRQPLERVEELEKENAECKSKIEDAAKANEIIRSDLNATMVKLARERHNTELLQKSLSGQTESHKELVEIVQKAQSSILDELTKGGVLASVVNSENLIRAKINEFTSFVNKVNNRQPQVSPSLNKLLEDFYTKIEDRLRGTKDQDAALKESNLRLFGDLMERIDQLRLDEEARNNLNEHISKLRESNAALTANGSAREDECQSMTKQINELKKELTDCRGQLTTKSDELTALRALPKEDPILRGKIQELENCKAAVQGQLNTANQEASRAKEELISCQEICRNAEEQSRELQNKLTEAQVLIKSLVEDQQKHTANQQAEIDKAKQEVAKIANSQKAEAKIKYDCIVKNLEQRRLEAEDKLAHAQEELQRSQEERTSYISNLTKVQEDLSACKTQSNQQSAFITHASQRIPTREEFERRHTKFQQAISAMAELRSHFDSVQEETSIKVRESIAINQDAEHLIKRVDVLEKEKRLLEEQKSATQKIHETSKTNIDRDLGRSELLAAAKQSVDECESITVCTSNQMGPPIIPVPKVVSSQQSSCTNFYLTHDDALRRGVRGIPKNTLQQNELKLTSPTQCPSTSVELFQATGVQNGRIDATQTNVQLPRERSTPGTTNSIITQPIGETSSTPYQANPRQLRLANRKSSGPVQSAHTEKLTNSSGRLNGPTSALHSAPSSSGKPSVFVQTLIGMTPLSTDVFRTSSSLTSNISAGHERFENPGDPPRSNTDRHEERAMAVETASNTPRFSGALFLPSSSPLSDCPSPVDQIEHNEEEVRETQIQTQALIEAHPTAKGSSVNWAPTQPANTTGGVKFEDPLGGHEPLNEDNYSVDNSIRNVLPPVPSISEESSRRRQPQNLKSALRPKSKTRETFMLDDPANDIFKIPMSTPTGPTLQNVVARAAASSKPGQPARKANVGSMYNRIARGSKPESSSQDSVAHSSIQRSSAITQMFGERSPLMEAPKRNSRKRSGSALPTQPPKPSKQPRMSRPHQGRKERRDVISDSQEERSRY